MYCPKCKNSESTKDGIVKKKQRYKCRSCNYRYTVELKSTSKPRNTKRQALELYLEGLGFRSIGRFLNVSHVSVYKWIKSYGKDLDDIKSEKKIEVVEMDEMHTYIGHKKYCWIWISVDRYGKRFVNCVFGNRGTQTGKRLWEELKEKEIGKFMTDYWKAYQEFLPEEKHIQSKAETFTVEGYNSLFRHFLARLRRKTKCYTKSLEMLIISVKLLMLKRNNQLSIL
ncbi:MAG: IS1 family transposase, partial [Cyclobacteriaceae bacterium]|nr:IS1 family transposase [Cyclobacteriaceae bacterium]